VAKTSTLLALAGRAAILPEYVDIFGQRRLTSDDTRVALLAAMGIDASSGTAAARTLAELEQGDAERLIEPVYVRRERDRRSARLQVRVPTDASRARIEYQLELREENGHTHLLEGRLERGSATHTVTLRLPAGLETGYHRIQLRLRAGGGEERHAESWWIVCPRSCLTTKELIGDRRLFGLWTHLYAIRGERDWGAGDLSDLGELIDWAGTIGSAFVGINPLHALRNSGGDISPYSPVSRLFRNIFYLDVTAVPELADSPEARRLVESERYGKVLAELQAAARVDYERVMALKRPVLDALHRTFAAQHRDRDGQRGRDYARFRADKGDALIDFATFCALEAHFGAQGRREPHDWPADYRHPRSKAVAAFRREHLEVVDLHCYLQFELDRQLAAAAQRAEATLPIGIYGDLAIGTAPNGCDPWAFPNLFLDGAHLGAPPDDYSAVGQDWGLPPLDPDQLRRDGYRYWALLLRNNLAHMGALRIDHVMGLFRQYWVPAGQPATEGAYVRYPAQDLLGILALESHRQRALIIGEDLGTVPRGFPALLARWGILSSRVLYFERDRHGNFHPSRRYSKRALVTVNTHDHPPLAAVWEGHDLELARRIGIIESDQRLAEAREQRARERQALLRRLVAEGCLPSTKAPASYAELSAAVHAFLARTRAPLLGIWLDDLAGELDPLNIPGVGLDRYPNWSRRLSMTLADFRQDPGVATALVGIANRRTSR
jgi:4-alpha-glucanotransferase